MNYSHNNINRHISSAMYFIVILILLILILHTYVYWHIWRVLPLAPITKTSILSIMTLCFACLFLYLSPIQDKLPMPLARTIYTLGTSWPIVFLYLFIIFVILDISIIFKLFSKELLINSIPFSVGITLFLLIVLFCGNVRYNHKYRREYNIKTNKTIRKPYKIVMCSDLHLGYNNSVEEFRRWVELINEEKADFILIAGDIIDGNIRPLEIEHIDKEFCNFNAPVYACLGNHEYLAGKKQSIDFYNKSKIHLLTDESIIINDIEIIGRDDRSNSNRKPLKDISSTNQLYKILLDHQPYNLDEAEKCNIDLQLSGHTHHGQIWPLNWITDLIYEYAYGYHSKGKTDYYISSGMGIWGGKFRICTTSEYIVINIH